MTTKMIYYDVCLCLQAPKKYIYICIYFKYRLYIYYMYTLYMTLCLRLFCLFYYFLCSRAANRLLFESIEKEP